MLHENIGINEKRHLTFAGCDTAELAEKYGWSIGKKKSGIQKGLDDIKAGRTYRAKDMNDLKQHLLG